jgi:cytochrome P450
LQFPITDRPKDLRETIKNIGKPDGTTEKEPEHATIFHHILASDLRQEEKSPVRLADEAQTVIGAGLTTTAWSLTTAVFFIVDNLRIQETLRAELRAAIPDPNAEDALSFQKLERLPYLSACIKEATRFAHGLSGRGPRVINAPMIYDKWTIPANTPISMTIADLHFDPAIYPKPREYIPERWLNSPKAPDGSSLDKYFVAFGKGPRSCLGIKYVFSVG